MIHLTLNTGHSRVSPRQEVSDEAIRALADTLTPGRHPVPVLAGYEAEAAVERRQIVVTVFAPGGRPLVLFGVAPDDDAAAELWPILERYYHALTEMPGLRSADFAAARRPETTPWVAAITILPAAEEAYWLADYEKCLAWAFLLSLEERR